MNPLEQYMRAFYPDYDPRNMTTEQAARKEGWIAGESHGSAAMARELTEKMHAIANQIPASLCCVEVDADA